MKSDKNDQNQVPGPASAVSLDRVSEGSECGIEELTVVAGGERPPDLTNQNRFEKTKCVELSAPASESNIGGRLRNVSGVKR